MSPAPLIAPLRQRWDQLPARERRALLLLVLFLTPILAWSLLLQPERAALQHAEQQYQRAQMLRFDLARLPASAPRASLAAKALPGLLARSSAEAQLTIERMDNESGGAIQLTLEGSLDALLGWLQTVERAGARVTRLGLEVNPDALARARLLVEPGH
ncbi:hypothetical protein A7D27_24980 [Pseudomonas sp. 1D4]|uniref:type II secretion system protein GspM n=1 Tax=Pseudomonadaceae TaxID=135621 RepID=UPI00084B00E0|nr:MULTISPECIES: type II secretion system protein GspM [Pseudomonas]OEC37668.1 hypothetical protein A7D27_24980 [Pseudomonas sp. 1D4]OEC52425.1 hypothetical protein A9G05_22035 [Pseudomonas sp. ENNP23]